MIRGENDVLEKIMTVLGVAFLASAVAYFVTGTVSTIVELAKTIGG